MPKHIFKITMEHISDRKDKPADEPPLVFHAENHDDIIELASRSGCSDDKELAFLVGLKLFGEALMANRQNPLYRDFLPHFGQFMQRLKKGRERGK